VELTLRIPGSETVQFLGAHRACLTDRLDRRVELYLEPEDTPRGPRRLPKYDYRAAVDRVDALIETFGRARFERAVATAWEGRGSDQDLDDLVGQELFDVASDLIERVWEGEATEAQRIAALINLYRRLPCTAIMHEMAIHHYSEMSVEGRRLMWDWLRVDLGSEDRRRADPILVYLSQEYFDSPNPRDFEQEWRWLVDDQPHDLAMRRVLGVSIKGASPRLDLIDEFEPLDAEALRRLRDDYLAAPDAWARESDPPVTVRTSLELPTEAEIVIEKV